MPALYETVVLGSTRSCQSGLRMLCERPEVCRWVRKLAVRPDYYLAWPRPDKPIDETWVAEQLAAIAHKRKLLSMHTFDWDGHEMPGNVLWDALRDGCPELRTLSTNVGYNPIDSSSSLFTFHNLKAFSLTVRHTPQSLWDMLIQHSPNLEELNLCSFSPATRLFDLSPLFTAQWPHLKCIVLGCFGFQHDFTLSFDVDSMNTWIAQHPALSYLRFVWSFKRWISPDEVPALPCTQIDSYAGIFQQIPLSAPSTLTTLDLMTEPIYDSRVRLEILDIWMQVTDGSFFHFMCTTAGEWAKRMQGLLVLHVPRLKVLSLTEGHRYRWRKKTMARFAAGIVRMNERLDQVNMRWVRERCKGHLKQEGRYDVVRGSDGGVKSVMVSERGFTLVGNTFTRCVEYKI
ncbi:hypothetical protein BDZ89DRAFT_1062723 [Hymenopellis radicata]|nr:hypothetical protein BDZ89DRAFT_1062723 [Hymenopellis radicata]